MRRPTFAAAIGLPFVVAVLPAASIFVSSPAPAGDEVYALDAAVPAGTTVELAGMATESPSATIPVAYGIGSAPSYGCEGTSATAIEG